MAQNPQDTYLANTLQGRPYAADSRVALGDPYYDTHAGDATNPVVEDEQWQRAVKRMIVDKAPEPWMNSLKILLMKPPAEVSGLTDTWYEQGLGIQAGIVQTGAAAEAGSANTTVTQTIVLTTGTADALPIDTLVGYPNSTARGVVRSNTSGTIVVGSAYGESLPLVSAGDVLTNMGQLRGDAMDRIAYVTRETQSERYNFIQTIATPLRFGNDELIQWKNQQMTNQYEMQMKRQLQNHRIQVFTSVFAGMRGANLLSGGENARTTGGVFYQMTEAGSFYDAITTASFKAAFEYGAFNSNFKSPGSRKMVMARSAVLNVFQETYKQFMTRYTNAEGDIKLDINSLTIGGVQYLLVPCDIFQYNDVFGPEYRNRMFVLDLDNIELTKLKNQYFMTASTTTRDLMQGSGSLRDYVYNILFSKFGVRHQFAENSFALDITDLVN